MEDTQKLNGQKLEQLEKAKEAEKKALIDECAQKLKEIDEAMAKMKDDFAKEKEALEKKRMAELKEKNDELQKTKEQHAAELVTLGE